MHFAINLSKRSDCKRAAVGCVITDNRGTKVYGIGYNGGAAGDDHRCSDEPGNCGCVHAEANALIKCHSHDTSKIMYTTTFPCKVCAKLIVNSGFTDVYYNAKYRDDRESFEILLKAGITTYHYHLSPRITPVQFEPVPQ